jgi:hypothetical protein
MNLSFSAGFMLAAFSFLSLNSNAQNENALLYHGNAFYWTDARIDTAEVADVETGETIIKIERVEGAITRMNNEHVYNGTYKETVPPVFQYNGKNEATYLQMIMKSRYNDIPAFTIQKMVINEYGKPVYFELIFDDASNARALKLKWEPAIEKLIVNMPRWEPGKYKNKPVLFYINPEVHIAE